MHILMQIIFILISLSAITHKNSKLVKIDKWWMLMLKIIAFRVNPGILGINSNQEPALHLQRKGPKTPILGAQIQDIMQATPDPQEITHNTTTKQSARSNHFGVILHKLILYTRQHCRIIKETAQMFIALKYYEVLIRGSCFIIKINIYPLKWSL